jgi:hypothetical protein
MQIHPVYKANEDIKKFLTPHDKIFAFEKIDKLFDKQWCDNIMHTLSNNKRNLYTTGKEIGDYKNPNQKYYLQIG